MREIRSPLDGILSPFAARSVDAYAVQGLSPLLVADFTTPYYRKAGSTSTFANTFTHSRAGNATMVDSDGLIKWAPHNVLTYSEEFAGGWAPTASSVTFPGGAEVREAATTGTHIAQLNGAPIPVGVVTAEVEVQGIDRDYIRLGALGGGTNVIFRLSTETVHNAGASISASVTALGDGYYKCKATWSQTSTNTFFVGMADDSGVTNYTGDVNKGAVFRKKWLYRSDLGGMVNNPDTGTSYVPTTDAAVYQARRNHYTYNGTSWTNSGLLLETEARTNIALRSNQFDTTWSPVGAPTINSAAATSPDGNTNAWSIEDDNASGYEGVRQNITVLNVTEYTASIFIKKTTGTLSSFPLMQWAPSGLSVGVVVDTTNGTISETGSPTNSGIESYGDYWRVFVSAVTSVTSTQFDFFPAGSIDGTSASAAGVGTAIIYGAQLEVGATPSFYMPTAGATFTRPTESLQIAAADMPWPTPNVIGAELVTNGEFETDASGWTLGGSSVYNNNAVDINVPSATVALQQTGFTPVIGKAYQISFDISNYVSGGLRALWGGYSTPFAISNGSFSHVFVATSTSGSLTFVNGGSAFEGTIDNISVREIDPLSVSLQMQGKMTYADTNVGGELTWYNWAADVNNRLLVYMATSAGTGQLNAFQAASGASDSISSTGSYYSPDILVPYNIASRHGSTFINGAVDGTALTANTTPTALPDLSATDLSLGHDYMGTIAQFRAWNKDIGDAGIAEASS